jgi:hypothetical protein
MQRQVLPRSLNQTTFLVEEKNMRTEKICLFVVAALLFATLSQAQAGWLEERAYKNQHHQRNSTAGPVRG